MRADRASPRPAPLSVGHDRRKAPIDAWDALNLMDDKLAQRRDIGGLGDRDNIVRTGHRMCGGDSRDRPQFGRDFLGLSRRRVDQNESLDRHLLSSCAFNAARELACSALYLESRPSGAVRTFFFI